MLLKIMSILALVSFSSTAEACKDFDEDAEPRIVIIGAGAAGISALSKLIDEGFKNLVLLEAESRIGGRIHTVPFASNVVDMGAQWVHGEQDNVIYETIQEYGVFDKTPVSYFAGYTSSQGQAKPEYEELGEIIDHISENFEREIRRFKGSLGKFVTQKYWQILESEKYQHIDNQTAKEFLNFAERLDSCDFGSDSWFEISTSAFSEFWDCKGYELWNWKDKGYSTFFDYITVIF